MSAEGDRPAQLEPSDLGTKEYWDHLYTSELRNHAADPSDIGTVWFDDSDAEAKVVDFLSDLASSSSSSPSSSPDAPSKQTASLLDLGCGNASLLFALRAAGWTGRARGVDYSPQSIALARQLAEWDVVAGPLDALLDGAQARGWDLVLDKGTFDAVSLSDERDAHGRRRPCEAYRDRVVRLVRPGGLFVVTSCNWTEPELVEWFAGRDDEGDRHQLGFAVAGRVQYRTFSFGGVKGQTISTVGFRKL
ncbi:methyltransferase domain-containing protein [Hirsutella rhossiliensis]|uniref:Protein-lysine N-methyltransferase EFM4 n=1 Tax=Hirsutella rhossiliensis TaxID=111463 RepID=A0A9P8MSF4_9HYPO|nr:methyltransferase domain-containing protein [Hirsutella rhossiliensis]KAH0960572.1 methyltransferase domain-containing protein [Hirsutella rhossiliensis]